MSKSPLEDKVSGQFILDILKGFGSYDQWIRDTFKKYGLEEIKPNEEYKISVCVELMNILFQESGPNTVFKLGMETSKLYRYLENSSLSFDSPHDIFPLFDSAYKLNVRAFEERSYYYYEKINKNQALFRSQTPFPCEFEKGFLTGTLHYIFHIPILHIEIDHLPKMDCKNYGNTFCSYLIMWK